MVRNASGPCFPSLSQAGSLTFIPDHPPLRMHNQTKIRRLGRCVSIITGEDGDLPRVKPFKYTYEKEIVMYAYFKK